VGFAGFLFAYSNFALMYVQVLFIIRLEVVSDMLIKRPPVAET